MQMQIFFFFEGDRAADVFNLQCQCGDELQTHNVPCDTAPRHQHAGDNRINTVNF